MVSIIPSISKVFSLDKEIVPSALTITGARGVMVIVVGNGHGDASSNPGRD